MPGSRIALAITAVCLLGTTTARGQAGPMAEEVFKNVEVLKGIPVKEFMSTMVFFPLPRA